MPYGKLVRGTFTPPTCSGCKGDGVVTLKGCPSQMRLQQSNCTLLEAFVFHRHAYATYSPNTKRIGPPVTLQFGASGSFQRIPKPRTHILRPIISRRLSVQLLVGPHGQAKYLQALDKSDRPGGHAGSPHCICHFRKLWLRCGWRRAAAIQANHHILLVASFPLLMSDSPLLQATLHSGPGEHYCMMSLSQRCQPNKRNKVLHRFYEPLVLLHVLDRVQGDHVPRQREDSSPPDHASRTELRRRFLESLAYVCDYEKGGDTMTAIFVTSTPLTYHIASNKPLPETNPVVPFLDSLLKRLRTVTHSAVGEERQILENCVAFSEKRISTYWRFLQNSLKICREATSDTEVLHCK